MDFSKMFPMIITDKLDQTKAFYTGLGFQAVFYNGWYLHLLRPGEAPVEIGFLQPGHETQPPIYRPAFKGEGLALGFEVDDVDAVHERMKRDGREIAVAPKDEPWGQRHFTIVDPNGIAIDIIQCTEPDAAWMAAQPDLTVDDVVEFA